MKMTRSRSVDLAAPRRRLKTTPAVSLWRPEIVLATSINAAPSSHNERPIHPLSVSHS